VVGIVSPYLSVQRRAFARPKRLRWGAAEAARWQGARVSRARRVDAEVLLRVAVRDKFGALRPIGRTERERRGRRRFQSVVRAGARRTLPAALLSVQERQRGGGARTWPNLTASCASEINFVGLCVTPKL